MALQRDEQLRSQFVSDVSVYNPDMIIFLDESGCDKRDYMKNCTHALPFDAILFIVINYFYYQEVSAPLITLANACSSLSRACVNAGK